MIGTRVMRPFRRRHRDTTADPHGTDDDGAEPDLERDEQLLATPLDDSDLEDRIAAAGGRRWRRSTIVLACVALVAVGFALGAAVGRAATDIQVAIAEAEAGDGAPGAEADPGVVDPPPGGPDDAAVTGTIRVVDGDSVYVEAADGTVTRVEVTDATTVTSTIAIERDDLRPGAPVVVRGDDGPDGTVTATEIDQGGD